MNKLIVPLTVVSVLGLFNAYSSFAENKAGINIEQANKQSAKQQAEKQSCCKSEKAKPGNCCACCAGASCASGIHDCCGQ